MIVCAKSWGGPFEWHFCTLPKGHEGTCINLVRGAKRPDERYFEEQPEVIAEHEKQLLEDRKRESKKARNQREP